MRIAIIGGGIAGLSAAYELELARAAGAQVDYQLFESSPRLGGVIASHYVDNTVLELGPDSFLTEKPAAAQLCRELGLAAALMGSNDAARKTYILIRNRLIPLPDGLMFLVPTQLVATLLSPLFSLGTKLRMALELRLGPSLTPTGPRPDESVAALVKRHYGQQVVDRLADPLLSGIYGGDATQLSARSVLPRFVSMEENYGSLTRAMLASLRARSSTTAAPPIFTTLRGGLQQMIDALVARLDPQRLHLQCPATQLHRADQSWSLQSALGQQPFDAIIVATPAWAAAELLTRLDRPLSEELAQIPYSSSITVNLVYAGADLDALPEGFGFLVPALEGRAMLACTFIHRKFPGRTAPGKAVLRAFLGGARKQQILDQSDQEIAHLVRRELRQILEISAIPERIEIQRWPRAMAQYSVGHQARIERIQEHLKALPGLSLIGNAYDGIGISDCIRLGRNAAQQALAAAKPEAFSASA